MQCEKHNELSVFARIIVCTILTSIWFCIFDKDYVVLISSLNYETIIEWDETGSLCLAGNMIMTVKRILFVFFATSTLVLIIQFLYKKITSIKTSNFELGMICGCLVGIEYMWMIENRLLVAEWLQASSQSLCYPMSDAWIIIGLMHLPLIGLFITLIET